MNNEQEYNELWHNAYGVAMHILRNSTDAEDIAQTCTIKYYLKKDEIENSSAWIKTVAKHEAFKLAKKQNKTYSLNTDFLVDQKNIPTAVDLDKYTDPDYDPPEDFTNTTIDAKELLNKEEYKIYKCYLNCKTDIKRFAKKMNLSYRVAISRMYQIKRNLRAAKYQKEGYCGSKKIVNYNLNKKIVHFIKTFTEKMKNNDLKSLHKYLEHYHKPIPKLDIYKVFDYEIFKLTEDKFRLGIPFINSSRKPGIFIVYFDINKKNNIKIYDFIDKSDKMIKLNITKEEALKKLKPLKKGILQESKEEIEEILKNDFIS